VGVTLERRTCLSGWCETPPSCLCAHHLLGKWSSIANLLITISTAQLFISKSLQLEVGYDWLVVSTPLRKYFIVKLDHFPK